jgi:thioredoxin reductase
LYQIFHLSVISYLCIDLIFGVIYFAADWSTKFILRPIGVQNLFCVQKKLKEQVYMNKQTQVDNIILGSGIAGYSAAISLAKAGQSVRIFELLSEAVIRGLFTINRTPLNPFKIDGGAFEDIVWNICTPLGLERSFEYIKDIIVDEENLSFISEKDHIWSAQSVIFAPSFSSPESPPEWIKNATNCLCKGLSYCAWSDMPFCKEKSVCIIGDGYRAYDQICWALYYTNDVTFLCSTSTYQGGVISEEQLQQLIPTLTGVQVYSIRLHEQQNALIVHFLAEGRVQQVRFDCVFWAPEGICDWSILGGKGRAKQLEKQGFIHFAGIAADTPLWDHHAQYQQGIEVAKQCL